MSEILIVLTVGLILALSAVGLMHFLWTVALEALQFYKKTKMNSLEKQRLASNLQIIDLLQQYVTENPSIRLGQAMIALGVLERSDSKTFFEEPDDILERVNKRVDNR